MPSISEKLVALNSINLAGSLNGSDDLALSSHEFQITLQSIVANVVEALGCTGALVATLEADQSLPIRAYAFKVDSSLAETLTGELDFQQLTTKTTINLAGKRYRDNLGVRAIKGENGRPVPFLISDQFYELFQPSGSKSQFEQIQCLAGIQQVIAIPICSGDDEVLGSLFAAANQPFSQQDIKFLTAFGQQAAVTIQAQRRLTETHALERVILSLQTSMTDETQALQTIVDAVVVKLGYAGAMVATLESNKALPVRAYRIDVAPNLLNQLEKQAGLSLVGPRSVVYLDDEKFKDNLSIRAITGDNGKPEKFVVSDKLHDLLRPIASRHLSDLAQHLIHIRQVIAVPFFLEDEVVGNLFVASRRPHFSERETELLATFGQQAAVGIRNARLYKKAEERRQIAQMFGKMAFSATANIHALRNQVGAFQAYVRLIELTANSPIEKRLELLANNPNILNQLNQAADILDNLHEPWRQAPDIATDVNSSLNWAIRKVFPRMTLDSQQKSASTEEGIILHRDFSDTKPFVKTSSDMLIEAFRVLLKNAVEAIRDSKRGQELWLSSRVCPDNFIEVTIRDSGIGIKPQDLSRIFDMGWSSKNGQGMGFGLFWTKDFVEGLGGSIEVESSWQQGTTFIITLPAFTENGSTRPH
jgi:signal transduction histidine kinase